jgi:hypothetical protein
MNLVSKLMQHYLNHETAIQAELRKVAPRLSLAFFQARSHLDRNLAVEKEPHEHSVQEQGCVETISNFLLSSMLREKNHMDLDGYAGGLYAFAFEGEEPRRSFIMHFVTRQLTSFVANLGVQLPYRASFQWSVDGNSGTLTVDLRKYGQSKQHVLTFSVPSHKANLAADLDALNGLYLEVQGATQQLLSSPLSWPACDPVADAEQKTAWEAATALLRSIPREQLRLLKKYPAILDRAVSDEVSRTQRRQWRIA